MKIVIAVFVVTGLWCSQTYSDLLVDQYMADPTRSPNGYSNHDGSKGYGPRFILDDFDTRGDVWPVNGLSFLHVWNTLTVPSGTGMTFEIWGDDNGVPDPTNVIVANVNSYEERVYGGEAFFRPIMETTIRFDQITLSGRFWFHATIHGPDNNFWLVSDHINGSELWIDYHDFGGLQPGSNLFGTPADAQYRLRGALIPEPSTLTVWSLVAVTMAGFRRRHR